MEKMNNYWTISNDQIQGKIMKKDSKIYNFSFLIKMRKVYDSLYFVSNIFIFLFKKIISLNLIYLLSKNIEIIVPVKFYLSRNFFISDFSNRDLKRFFTPFDLKLLTTKI